MFREVLTIFVAAILCVSYLGGCKKTSSETEGEQDVVKTEAEYKAEAEKEINQENMAEELEKLEKQIEQDINQEP